MKIELWQIGKTSQDYIEEGVTVYNGRLKHYLPFGLQTIPALKKTKNLSKDQIKQKEGEEILKKLNSSDYLILLDERGKELTSKDFATYVERLLLLSRHKAVFLIGGAYGFSPKIYERANAKIALSKMTFSHQMVRLFFMEQLYRAMTILKNEPYHH